MLIGTHIADWWVLQAPDFLDIIYIFIFPPDFMDIIDFDLLIFPPDIFPKLSNLSSDIDGLHKLVEGSSLAAFLGFHLASEHLSLSAHLPRT